MELTLTGGSTLSDHSPPTPLHSNVNGGGASGSNQAAGGNLQPHNHNHSHSHVHHHTHNGQCCSHQGQPRPVPKINASTLLPTKEHTQRFKNDKNYRLNILSNVVRGGPYALFIDLVCILVEDGESKQRSNAESSDKVESENEATLKNADPASLAPLLDGHGHDGHTLAHWCAKRGEHTSYLLSACFVHMYVHVLLTLFCFANPQSRRRASLSFIPNR